MTLHGPDLSVHARRRAAVVSALESAVLFLPVVPERVYSNDVHYAYRTDSNIRYLTGYEDPAALLISNCGADESGTTLFVQQHDPQAETWTGRRVGVEGACELYGIDHAYTLDRAYDVLTDHLKKARTLYYASGRNRPADEAVLEAIRSVDRERPRTGDVPILVTEASALLDEMRLFKEAEEVERLRTACRVSAAAHHRLLECLRPGMYEYQVQAIVEYAFRDAGCAGPAYGTIAAGGANATVLHYTRNDKLLENGELLLVDAGGEYGGYCADITRTSPVGTEYSKAQAELYDVVLGAQQAAIDTVKPGACYQDVHAAAVRSITEGLLALGLLSGSLDECIETNGHTKYYMHRTGHWLGMDVHDVGSYKVGGASRVLEPSMVLTVEPGIYVADGSDAPERYRGIGIRIEDDVLVTTTGCEVLTADAPKARTEVERLRRGAARAA
jgi:Xaa-Pro aminopeptidase